MTVGGVPVALSRHAQRLVAYLAIGGRSVSRGTLAGTLWPDRTQARADGNLRSTLWRLQQLQQRQLGGTEAADAELLAVTPSGLRLAPSVECDVHAVAGRARWLIGLAPGEVPREAELDVQVLQGELLPTWSDEWVVFERERLRQLRLHAMDALCDRLLDAERPSDAVHVALAAIATEPLRESAWRRLLAAHMREGNRAEARRVYRQLQAMLRDELGVDPAPATAALLTE